MAEQTTYPIISSKVLGRVERRFWGRSKRNVETELPEQAPGSVLVFENGAEIEALRGPTQLAGSEDFVVASKVVHVVDISRHRLVPIAVKLPTAVEGGELSVIVTFSCSVFDPTQIVRDGLSDITGELQSWLQRHDLALESQLIPREDRSTFRKTMDAMVRAMAKADPLEIPGVHVELGSVEVPTLELERDHLNRLDAVRRSQEIERMRMKFTREQADIYHELMTQGPAALEALFVATRDISGVAAVERAYRRDEQQAVRDYQIQITQETALVEVLKVLQESGHLDRARIDGARMAGAIIDRVMGGASGLPTAKDSSQGSVPSLTNEGDSSLEAKVKSPNSEKNETIILPKEDQFESGSRSRDIRPDPSLDDE